MAGVVENVMTTLGAKDAPPILSESGALRGSLTEILAKNSESLHLALTQESATKDTNAIPQASPTANIPRETMRNVLSGLAEEPANITVLKEAEERYTRAALSLIAGESAQPDFGRVQTFARDSGDAFGFLDAAVSKDVLDRAAASDLAEGEADKRYERWVGASIDGISAGALFKAAAAVQTHGIIAPIAAIATVGVNGIVGEFYQAFPPDAGEQAREQVHGAYVSGRVQVEGVMRTWMAENPTYKSVELGNEAGRAYSAIVPSEIVMK
ncbi:hypothetical protein [Embleya sp. NPDC005971]